MTAEVAAALEGRARSLVDDGVYGRCASLFVAHRGDVLVDVVVRAPSAPGPAVPVYPAYCFTKPLLALAVGHLLDAGRLSLDAPAAPSLPGWGLGGATVAHLLTHDAGLGWPPAFWWRMHPPERRDALLAGSPPAAPGTAAYSEVRAWRVLERVVQEAAGVDAGRFVQERVVDPLGLDDLRVAPGAALDAMRAGRIEVPVAGLPVAEAPLLTERLAVTVADVAPCFSGYVATGAVGRLFAALLCVLRGERVAGLPSPAVLRLLLGTRRGRRHDEVLGRTCDFACGFMVDLADHGITGRAGAAAFGHVAGPTPAFVVADPDAEAVVAFQADGVTTVVEEQLAVRRQVSGHVFELVEQRCAATSS